MAKVEPSERILIRASMTCETGLHIGAEQDSTEIGGVEAPVVRDPLTLEPYVPGSSLKGSLRSNSERRAFVRKGMPTGFFNKRMSPRNAPDVFHHECNEPDCLPCRLFGASASREVGENRPARLIVRDAKMTNVSTFSNAGLDSISEVKNENTLDRITSAASPRKIERVPRGAQFLVELVYRADEPADLEVDLQEILTCLSVLADDYLGGSGSRGYGKVSFSDLSVERRPVVYYEGKVGDSEAMRGKWQTLKDAQASIKSLLGDGR